MKRENPRAPRDSERAVPRHHHQDNPADRDYHDLHSLTDRQWGEPQRDDSFGYRGQGGYGDFTQGGYGESQGRHAQSGSGRGGSATADTGRVSAGVSHRGRGPRNYTRSDESIVDELIARMTDHDQLDATEILLMVEDGVVTLTGEVPERRMKHIAEDLADAVHGVRDIENRIRVDNGLTSFGPRGGAVRSGNNQVGSGFSSSGRIGDPLDDDSVRVGRAGTEPDAPELRHANLDAGAARGKN